MQLQTFVNTILGQGWRKQGVEIDETSLVSQAEPFGLDDIPPDVLLLRTGATFPMTGSRPLLRMVAIWHLLHPPPRRHIRAARDDST